jgi:helicase
VSQDGIRGAVKDPGITRLKSTDADGFPPVPPGTGARVLLPAGEQFAVLADKLFAAGAEVRRVRYLVEDELITSAGDDRELAAVSWACRLNRPYRATFAEVTGNAAAAARDAFDVLWDDHPPVAQAGPDEVAAERLVPADLLPFLPFRSLNPAQAQAVPAVLGHDDNLLVVAPTGSGKTVIGMTAALRAVVQQGRKAAWLVPQRSLTDELDSELAGWRRQGLRVERLSGEHAVDIERINEADLWVATTEKFEAICRASAFREALAGVGALVVDEIHMLGDSGRGSVLEALLARIRDSVAGTRIVGLSATVTNAPQIAAWLRADLLRINWRPSRLTWQLPVIPGNADFAVTEAARIRLTSAITEMVAADEGSVLVFCGSKRNVRRTALVIAASRGVDVSGMRPDNVDRLQRVCREARIGLHYQGWEHRREAEQAFRRREVDVLVATSTVAAGVNLPARAVIVQDTQIGLNDVDVATVQQMFGRAGRVGAGESQGWAFMIVEDHERAAWQSSLVAGHTVRSQLQENLPEHVLSEAVQQRITTLEDAGRWWVQTLAHHQGSHSVRPLHRSVEFLRSAEMLAGDEHLVPTELGRLTARLMVSPQVCADLRRALNAMPAPAGTRAAEAALIEILAVTVPKLARARAGADSKNALAKLLDDYDRAAPRARSARAAGADGGAQRGDLARAALLTAASRPEAFTPGVRQIGGVPYAAMYQVLEEAPRYLHWIACQGLFGTVHPWCAIVAADLEMRTSWRTLHPPRGAGRLLWACEQIATSAYAAHIVPRLWAAARARGHTSPDWPSTGRPAHCQLDEPAYQAFLRDRATGIVIETADDEVRATGPAGSVLTVWNGAAYQTTPIRRGHATATPPAGGTGKAGAAVFTWRNDYRATGWLAAYSRLPG